MADQWASGSSCLCMPRVGIISVHHQHIKLFYLSPGTWTWILLLARQRSLLSELYPQSDCWLIKMNVCVWTFAFMYEQARMCANPWKPEKYLIHVILRKSLLAPLRQDSSLAWRSPLPQAGCPASSWGPPVYTTPVIWVLNLDLPTCKASSLLTELSPQPQIFSADRTSTTKQNPNLCYGCTCLCTHSPTTVVSAGERSGTRINVGSINNNCAFHSICHLFEFFKKKNSKNNEQGFTM